MTEINRLEEIINERDIGIGDGIEDTQPMEWTEME